MSKLVKEKEENKKDNIGKLKIAVGVLVGIIIGLVGGVFVATNVINKDKGNTIVENTETEDVSGITTYLYDSNILEGEELATACDALTERLDTIQNSNAYMQIQVGESDYDTYIYNKTGECFAQSASGTFTAVTRSDGKSVKLDLSNSSVIVESDLDVLTLMKNIVSIAKENTENVTFYDMVMNDNTAKEYRIDMIGAEVFKQSYAMFSEELATTMLDSLMTEMREDWEPHFIYTFIITENDLQLCCYVIEDNQEYVNWASQGYILLDDWKLSEDWYNDFDNEDFDTVVGMMENLIVDIEGIVQKYALENGLITQEEIDALNAETTETVENETEQTAEETTETVENTEETVENETETVTAE